MTYATTPSHRYMNFRSKFTLPPLPLPSPWSLSSADVCVSTSAAWLAAIKPSTTATEGSGSFKGLEVHLGRVDFNDLEEGEVLGEGTFGTVMSGTYRGRDVAIKKARGAIGSTSIMEAFRWAHGTHIRVTTLTNPSPPNFVAYALRGILFLLFRNRRTPPHPYLVSPALRRTPQTLRTPVYGYDMTADCSWWWYHWDYYYCNSGIACWRSYVRVTPRCRR